MSRRVLEWGLLSVVILVLGLVFLRQVQVVQGQAELASIKATLGALRTAAMLADLKARASSGEATEPAALRNPFLLLNKHTGNYAGEVTGVAQASGVAPGNWFFEPECACVGYAPTNPDLLTSPAHASVLRFRVFSGQGLLRVTAMEPYRWQGQVVD